MSSDSPDVVHAKRLLDELKSRGFQFRRTAPGPDGPLVGTRVAGPWSDTIQIAGFSRDCAAWRTRSSALLVLVDEPVQRRIQGSALAVLADVLTWDTTP